MDKPQNTKASSEENQLFEAIIQTATDGMIVIDRHGRMERINDAAATLFGYSIKEMTGKNVSMLMPAHHSAQHDQYILNYLQTGKAKIIGIGREVQGLKKNGEIFPIRLSISEVKFTDRILFTGIVHDLTREKAAEAAIRNMNAELEKRVEQRTEELAAAVNQLLTINNRLEKEIQERKAAETALRHNQEELRKAYEKEVELNKLKSRFVSMASHEFRTPLSTILSSADLIEAYTQESQQSKREKHTNRIKSAVANLTSILNDFLSLSRLEEGRTTCAPSTFEIDHFCNDIIEDMRGMLKPGQQIVHQNNSESAVVYLDQKLLKNVMYNLLSNAIKYSEANTTIYCSIFLSAHDLQISIRDQGIGIPEEEQQHLFTRFFRAHNVENIQGTGLGLNIVKRYVELMEGNITFESKLGEGTTFYVHLPLKSPEA